MKRFWHTINRWSDMRTLWPVCRKTSPTLDEAKLAFFMHVSNDRSWTDHYTELELLDFVQKLK